VSIGDAAREARVAVNYQIQGESIDWAVPVVFARDPSERLVAPREAVTPYRGTASTRTRSRRVSRGRSDALLKVALWDVNGAFPQLEEVAARLNGAQRAIWFDVVDVSAPLGTWQVRKEENGGSYLDPKEVAHKLRGKPSELGADLLFCITILPLRDGDERDIYLWDIDTTNQISIFSTAPIAEPIAKKKRSLERALVNNLAGAIAGLRGDLPMHRRGPKSCPAYENREVDITAMTGAMKFDARCRRQLVSAVGREVVGSLEACLRDV
jgi:hypothetical protein